MTILAIVIVILTIKACYQVVRESISAENHCLEYETYYYRSEGGWLFGRDIETNEENADGQKTRCLRWEEVPSVAKAILGQRLIKKEVGK